MDAVLDAKRPVGFSEELVKEKVRELLNVGLFLVSLCSLFFRKQKHFWVLGFVWIVMWVLV